MNHILYLPTRFFPSISGAEFYFQRMAEILTTNYNYNIDIFTSNAIDFKALRNFNGRTINRNDKYFDRVNNLSINRFPVNYNLSVQEILNKLNNISAYRKLNLNDRSLELFIENGPYLDQLLEFLLNKPDLNYKLVHSTFFPYFNCIISLIVGTSTNIPKVCTPFFHFSNPRYSDPRLIDVLKKFDLLIACTNLEKNYLNKKCSISEDKIKVIPMGVDYSKFKTNQKATLSHYSFKENFFNKKEKRYKLILFCGYKNYEKGALSILRSIPYILKKIKKVYFVFIGPPTLAFNKELSKISKLENARIINFTPENLTGYYDKKKIAAFKEADLYLMPSRSDAFGISFLEAWSAGKPVIGAKIGATPEVIRENIDGLLVEFDDHKDIAQKVINLLKNKGLRKRYGLAGKIKVCQKFTWEIIAKMTHNTYQHIIKNNN
ncbi:MAG: glycosyltransferase family 4 protein [Candidatus Lokiarchaeia archaeon]|nr:glycosyltransferase family 4 protein [Candidatus Lokiarchaeia archaeon]